MSGPRTLLHEQNPVSLSTAFVQENGGRTYLVLLPKVSSVPQSRGPRKSSSISLYRRKRSHFAELLFILGRGPAHEESPKLSRMSGSAGETGHLRGLFRQIAYRVFVVSYRRGIRAMEFKEVPELRLVWSDSGRSVGVLLMESRGHLFTREGIAAIARAFLRSKRATNGTKSYSKRRSCSAEDYKTAV